MSMIYALIGGLPGTCLALTGVNLNAFTNLLMASPFRLVFSLLTIEAVLIFADTRASLNPLGPAFAAPIGLPPPSADEAAPPSFRSSGRLGLTAAIVLALIAAAAQAYLIPTRLQQGMDEARDHQAQGE